MYIKPNPSSLSYAICHLRRSLVYLQKSNNYVYTQIMPKREESRDLEREDKVVLKGGQESWRMRE